MKKLLLLALAVIALVSLLTGCGEKKEEPAEPVSEVTEVTEVAPAQETEAEPQASGEEQVGVGNTDASMVALVLEQHYMDNYSGEVLEVIPTNIKVYTQEEIDANSVFADYDLKEGDIVFEAEYELTLAEGVEDAMKFTAGTGDVSGDKIINKANVGIARATENGYTLDAFGTAF